MDDLLKALLPVMVDLAKDYVTAGDDDARDEARRKAERATSDRLMLWSMARGSTEPPAE